MRHPEEHSYTTGQGQPLPIFRPNLAKRLKVFVVCLFAVGLIIAMLLPKPGGRVPSRRSICSNNLKQLAIAVLNYESAFGHLPPAFTVDKNGQPLHSWRTLILPFLEQNKLYESIDLTKPWDDPVNKHARAQTPDCYKCPSVKLEPGFTTYLANAGEKGALTSGNKRRLADLLDGTANTVLAFEVNADQAVEWMSPQDGDYETLMKTIQAERQPHGRTVNIVMADAASEYIRIGELTSETLQPFFTIAEGDKADRENLYPNKR